ncbi:MAG TPA: gliding motility-associated C-terminal domain-containing protein, partial [Puia sp.]|nr:gliding motility-associated C-terminal domain-containing protein [Puia sp.]
FGTSLLNIPTQVDLGNFSQALPLTPEGIQLIRVNGKWIAIITGGNTYGANNESRVIKMDFGNSLANTPTATNWGNIGALNFPDDIFIANDGGTYIGYAINVLDNTLTRWNFGTDFSGVPTGTNLGNPGGTVDWPVGSGYFNYNGKWYGFIANRNSNSLTRLDFGTSLANTPTAVNIGNPGGLLNYPRDFAIFATCGEIYGFVPNEGTNALVKLDFGSDPTNPSPTATSLGNIGNLDYPHSITNLFRAGNDVYAFICNAYSNTLSRMRFAGCQDIPGSTAAAPAPVTYHTPGTYTISLLVDVGLPTQTSYCQKITVLASPLGTIQGDTVCFGSSPALNFAGTGTGPFDISFSDGNQTYTQGGLPVQSSIPLPNTLTAPGSAEFVLQKVSDGTGCSTSLNQSTNILIRPAPQSGITGTTICGSDSALISLQAGAGVPPFEVQISNGSTSFVVNGVKPGAAFPVAFPGMNAAANFSLMEVKDSVGCPEETGFAPGVTNVVPLPAPAVVFPSLGAVCYDKEPFVLGTASETTGLAGTGVYSGSGIATGGTFSPAAAGPGAHEIKYTYVAADGCTAVDSSVITVNALPKASTVPLITACEGVPVRLTASGGNTYLWSPAGDLSDPTSQTPVATVDTTTMFIVEVTDSNGCSATDSILVKASVTAQTAFVVPSAFTPNGDGHNDCFGIQHWGDVTIEQLDVFNRQGMMVFTTKNPAECWDGRFKGQMQPTGAYVYAIRARTACGEITRTGVIMLIR